MKATLEFNLPEEQQEFEQASNGWRYHSVLWDFDQWLRGEYKYQGIEAAYVIRQKLHEFMDDNKISLD